MIQIVHSGSSATNNDLLTVCPEQGKLKDMIIKYKTHGCQVLVTLKVYNAILLRFIASQTDLRCLLFPTRSAWTRARRIIKVTNKKGNNIAGLKIWLWFLQCWMYFSLNLWEIWSSQFAIRCYFHSESFWERSETIFSNQSSNKKVGRSLTVRLYCEIKWWRRIVVLHWTVYNNATHNDYGILNNGWYMRLRTAFGVIISIISFVLIQVTKLLPIVTQVFDDSWTTVDIIVHHDLG